MRKLIALLLFITAVAMADTWEYPPERTVTEFEFGNTKIHRIVDATKNQRYPDFTIDVYYARELVARYRGLSFDRLEPMADNRLFIGLSNSGLPGTAIVVFDASGNLRLLRDHDLDESQFRYCDKSVVLIREWFDETNPVVRSTDPQGVETVQIRACDGSLISLNQFASP